MVTAQILASSEMRRDFAAASSAYRDYERIMSAGNDSRNVSGVGTHGEGRGSGSDLLRTDGILMRSIINYLNSKELRLIKFGQAEPEMTRAIRGVASPLRPALIRRLRSFRGK